MTTTQTTPQTQTFQLPKVGEQVTITDGDTENTLTVTKLVRKNGNLVVFGKTTFGEVVCEVPLSLVTKIKKVQHLKNGDKIAFSRVKDEQEQHGTVRNIVAIGKEVRIWYYDNVGELSLAIATKNEEILVFVS